MTITPPPSKSREEEPHKKSATIVTIATDTARHCDGNISCNSPFWLLWLNQWVLPPKATTLACFHQKWENFCHNLECKISTCLGLHFFTVSLLTYSIPNPKTARVISHQSQTPFRILKAVHLNIFSLIGSLTVALKSTVTSRIKCWIRKRWLVLLILFIVVFNCCISKFALFFLASPLITTFWCRSQMQLEESWRSHQELHY